MNVIPSRRGFTLVELLVVSGLLAALFALVLGGLGRPNVASSVRRAAQDFASQLLAVQSAALGKPEGAALIVGPDTSNLRMGTVVMRASSHSWLPVMVTGTGTAAVGDPQFPRVTTVELVTTADAEVNSTAYKIRFQPSLSGSQARPAASPWFAYTSTSGSTGTMRFRTTAGQTLANTIWPKDLKLWEVTRVQYSAAVARYPTPAGSGPSMAKLVAIDLRHSGMGEDPAASNGYGRFEGFGSIAIAYEQVGRVGEVMRRVQEARTAADQPIETTGVIYFLFAPREDISAGRNTLANPQSVWVAINPQTGRVTVAENIAQSAQDKVALAAARRNARAGAAMK